MKTLNTILVSILLIFCTEFSFYKPLEINSFKVDFNSITNADEQQPIEVKWETLIDIEFKERYFKSIDMVANAPVFGSEQLALDGQVVKITGYIIPYDEEENYLSLSANPYASCFFCGGGGAEAGDGISIC